VTDANDLVTVDSASGRVKIIARLSVDVGKVGSIAFIPGSDTLIGSASKNSVGNRFFIDIINGQVSDLVTLSSKRVQQGLGYVLDLGVCEASGEAKIQVVRGFPLVAVDRPARWKPIGDRLDGGLVSRRIPARSWNLSAWEAATTGCTTSHRHRTSVFLSGNARLGRAAIRFSLPLRATATETESRIVF
jgi:hypothetical protein